jgi:hypothetical protein
LPNFLTLLLSIHKKEKICLLPGFAQRLPVCETDLVCGLYSVFCSHPTRDSVNQYKPFIRQSGDALLVESLTQKSLLRKFACNGRNKQGGCCFS